MLDIICHSKIVKPPLSAWGAMKKCLEVNILNPVTTEIQGKSMI